MKSTIKVLQVLETLCTSNGLTIPELCEKLDIKMSSMYRFLDVLIKTGYVQKEDTNKKYFSTLKVFQLGLTVRSKLSLTNLSRPYLEELNKQFHETVNLALFIDNCAVVIDRAESLDGIRTNPGIGRHMPAYCTALGKVFLANLDQEDLENYFSETELKEYTEFTITSGDELRKELIKIKEEKIAIEDRELDYGFRCISSPIRDDSTKVIAAMSISASSSRVSATHLQTFKTHLFNSAMEISKKLGYSIETSNPIIG